MARKHMMKLAAATPEVAADKAGATLKSFSKGDRDRPGFSFTRYWWLGEGGREGIAPWVRRKLKPGDDPKFGHTARSEVLLPASAPGDYASIEFLLQRFDDTLPPFESHAMVQAKITLDDSEP
ncbi:hypothetical protein [Novosphingobium mathurense]|uniref:Uncharacterized protein n=1 Tax=Novosphingobium mathurense TaxID=428990 RepID=A0A1U6IRE5_9SPHN|nr:hypothetical protein [Novosphingobium mathurense]SLK10611.1 hypothetical protein SAMN06295987_11226 [Novosphingobium mathurense]